jgi:hypothetical protein
MDTCPIMVTTYFATTSRRRLRIPVAQRCGAPTVDGVLCQKHAEEKASLDAAIARRNSQKFAEFLQKGKRHGHLR